MCALSFLVDLVSRDWREPRAAVLVAPAPEWFLAAGPDGPVVGKTSDCVPEGGKSGWCQRLVRPTGGFAALIHSHIGSPNAEMGMNDQGLAIGISGLLSKAKLTGDGVGWQQDIRAILHACATTRQAIEMLRAIPIRRAGYAAVVADASGDVVVVEKVVNCAAVCKPVSTIVYEANIALRVRRLCLTLIRMWCGDNGERRTALLQRLQQHSGATSPPGAWIDLFLHP